jgi:hypothetical protein
VDVEEKYAVFCAFFSNVWLKWQDSARPEPSLGGGIELQNRSATGVYGESIAQPFTVARQMASAGARRLRIMTVPAWSECKEDGTGPWFFKAHKSKGLAAWFGRARLKLLVGATREYCEPILLYFRLRTK